MFFRAFVSLSLVCLLVLAPSQGLLGNSADELKKQIKESEQRLEELQQQSEEYQSAIAEHQHEADSLQDQVDEFNHQINQLQAEINITEQQIATKQLHIQQTSLEIRQTEADIEQEYTTILFLFRAMQKNYERNIVEIILENNNLSDFFDDIHAKQTIQDQINDNLQALQAFQEELEDKEVQLLLEQEELEELEEQLGGQKQILAQQRATQQDLLTQTQNQQRSYERLLTKTRTEEKEINEEIFELEEKLRQALNPSAIPTGRFHFPTTGKVTQHYGCVHTSFARRAYKNCNGGQGGWHNGVDISAPLGTPIYAVQGGTIADIGRSNTGYGNWVAVRHSNGLVSLYAHLSAITASVGSVVKTGDVIARMGSTGFSTGSHLHFVVYGGSFRVIVSRGRKIPIGATVDPFNYVPRVAVGARISI